MVFKNWRWFDNSGSSKNLRIFYGLENWSPFVLWRINISHCEKHLFSISKNFFDSLTFTSTGSRSWKFFRKKDPFWVKNVKTLWDFSHWWVEPPEKRKILPWWWEDFSKIPFAFSALTSSGVCHSFREIARISLSNFEKRHNFFSTIFLNFDTLNQWKSLKKIWRKTYRFHF